MKKFFEEFREFALKGNVMDMAIGVIIGGAFQNIVKALIDDIINPLIGLLFQADFSNVVIPMGNSGVSLAIGAFIIPFVFAASPALLFIDTVWYEVVLITITATLGMMGVAAGLSGYLLTNMNVLERLLVIGGGLALIVPGWLTDVIGLSLIALGCVIQWMRARRATA